MAKINGVAEEFWSEVFNLHAPIDEVPRSKLSSKLRSRKLRLVVARDTRLPRAS